MKTPATTRYRPPPRRLSIRQVMFALRLPSYRRAWELVLSGALGDVEQANGLTYTVAETAVQEYARSTRSPSAEPPSPK